jgi:hypothetical protein
VPNINTLYYQFQASVFYPPADIIDKISLSRYVGIAPLKFRAVLALKNRASSIYYGRTATLQMLHFMYFFNKNKYWVF